MASIRKRGNSYQVRYRDTAGRQRSQSYSKRSDAERFSNIVEADKARGAWLDPVLAKTRVDEWAGIWLSVKINLKPKTRVGYESLLSVHILPVFGATPLARLTPMQIREWVATLQANGLSPEL